MCLTFNNECYNVNLRNDLPTLGTISTLHKSRFGTEQVRGQTFS